jgi:hypothetical protein
MFSSAALGAIAPITAGANSFPRKGQGSALDLHPTAKPIALVSDVILDSTKRDDIVLDPYCGSGTTLLAAERTGRRAYGIEIDLLYVDTAIERWERMTGMGAARLSDVRNIKAERTRHESPAEGSRGRLQTTSQNRHNGKRDNTAIQSANINAHPEEPWRSSTPRSRSKLSLSKRENHGV